MNLRPGLWLICAPLISLVFSVGMPAYSQAGVPQAGSAKEPGLNVMQFGCKGDGVSDDSHCLQSASDYAKDHHLGRMTLGSGTFLLQNGVHLDGDSLVLEGQGTATGSASRATVLKCGANVDCVTVGGSKEIDDVSVRDLTITNGSTKGTGSCLKIDGRVGTIARLRIERVETIECGKYGIDFEGGQGGGGFIFSVGLRAIGIDRVGGIGLYIHGRVGQLSAQNVWTASAPAPFVIDGGKLAEAGGIDFQDLTASNSDGSHYCMQLRDAASLAFRNPHLEGCPAGLVLFQSVQNSTFDGGGYYKLEGNALGFTFDVGASRGCDCNILLNPQGATNTSTHKFIHNTGGATIGNVQLGWASRHRLTRADIEGVLPEFIGSDDRGFMPIGMTGDPVQFADATRKQGTQGILFDAVWRDPKTNEVYIGNDSVAGPNGMVSKGPARFEKNVSIGVPGQNAGVPMLQVNGTISAAGISTPVRTLPASTHPAFDAAAGGVQKIVLTGDVASSTLVHAVSGQTLTFIVCQDGRGGWRFAWPPQMKGAPQVSTAAGTCTSQQFLFDGTDAYPMAAPVTFRR